MKKSMKKYDLLALGEVLLKLAAPENERLEIRPMKGIFDDED